MPPYIKKSFAKKTLFFLSKLIPDFNYSSVSLPNKLSLQKLPLIKYQLDLYWCSLGFDLIKDWLLVNNWYKSRLDQVVAHSFGTWSALKAKSHWDFLWLAVSKYWLGIDTILCYTGIVLLQLLGFALRINFQGLILTSLMSITEVWDPPASEQ
jgi:hypothetical protein